MNCPRCNKGFQSDIYENINIDNCPHCGGIWLDAGELEPILTTHDAKFSPHEIEKSLKEAHNNIPKAEQEILLPCPKCSALMNALNYNYSSGVIINACQQGDGLWFDKKELNKVQIYMEHWDDEKNKDKWKSLHEQDRISEETQLEESEKLERSKSGPVGKAIDAIIEMLR